MTHLGTMTIDRAARLGRVAGHAIDESVGQLARWARCSCGWKGQVDRRGNAWAQVSMLRRQEREHLSSVSTASQTGDQS